MLFRDGYSNFIKHNFTSSLAGRMKDESSQCILNNFQLENLRRHVYKSTGKTVLDPYMQVILNLLLTSL